MPAPKKHPDRVMVIRNGTLPRGTARTVDPIVEQLSAAWGTSRSATNGRLIEIGAQHVEGGGGGGLRAIEGGAASTEPEPTEGPNVELQNSRGPESFKIPLDRAQAIGVWLIAIAAQAPTLAPANEGEGRESSGQKNGGDEGILSRGSVAALGNPGQRAAA